MTAKKTELEYRLKIAPYTDTQKGIEGHLFELSTLADFRTFKYEILVDIEVTNDAIYLTIQGISTPQFSIPEHGPAFFRTVIGNLHGEREVVVSKTNGPKSKFAVRFTPKKTIRTGRAKKSFVEIETTHNE